MRRLITIQKSRGILFWFQALCTYYCFTFEDPLILQYISFNILQMVNSKATNTTSYVRDYFTLRYDTWMIYYVFYCMSFCYWLLIARTTVRLVKALELLRNLKTSLLSWPIITNTKGLVRIKGVPKQPGGSVRTGLLVCRLSSVALLRRLAPMHRHNGHGMGHGMHTIKFQNLTLFLCHWLFRNQQRLLLWPMV